MHSSKLIYIIAGEASGDLHAANLVRELSRQNPSLRFEGLGGDMMTQAGVRLDLDFTKMAVVGFWEVLKHYKEFKKVFEQTIERLQNNPPTAVVLVDYPGFNLRLARRIKELNIPTKIIYYISPQVWAWKARRVYAIQKYVDRMLVLFEFEKTFYARYGVDVDFVGHPLIEHVHATQTRNDVLKSLNLSSQHPVVGLMPGSRIKEVDRHLPAMVSAFQRLKTKHPNLQGVVVQAPTISREFLQSLINDSSIIIAHQDNYSTIAACDACMVASGTATLEVALLNTPMLALYKTSWPTYLLAKSLVKIPHISLVNIVAQKEVIPEFLQDQASPEHLSRALEKILTDENIRKNMQEGFKTVRHALGDAGACEKTARRILEII